MRAPAIAAIAGCAVGRDDLLTLQCRAAVGVHEGSVRAYEGKLQHDDEDDRCAKKTARCVDHCHDASEREPAALCPGQLSAAGGPRARPAARKTRLARTVA